LRPSAASAAPTSQFPARRSGDPACVVARGDRIRADLAWFPRRDALDAIVADAVAWERKLP
jgi:UDP-glucose 4-epimerase